MKAKLFETSTISPCLGSMGPYMNRRQAREILEKNMNTFLANPTIKLVSTQYGTRIEDEETHYSCMVLYDDTPVSQPKRTTKKK